MTYTGTFEGPAPGSQTVAAVDGEPWNLFAGDGWDRHYATRYFKPPYDGQLLPAMRAVHPGADIATETIGEVVGLEPMTANAARDLAAELTGGNIADVVPFGTEAGLFQSLGIDVVVCGPGSIEQAHKPDEFVAEAQLSLCLAMLDRLGGRLIA